VKLNIIESVPPVANPHRRVPINLRQQVEETIENLLRDGVIEQVVDGPTSWVMNPVFVPKSDGKIRVCVDMRPANKAIKRTRHLVPTVDELISDINGSSVFSKLDLNQGYHQLLLGEDRRHITTFSTHMGLFRYKRLNFGINCASEIFQDAVRSRLKGIPNVTNVSDDILIYTKDAEKHKIVLKQVLDRLSESGQTLNQEKCAMFKSSLKYLGFIFNSEGISPDPDKVKSIKETSPPTNPTEVRSFMGMVTTFCGRFIPGLALLSEPLLQLTLKDTKWQWCDVHQKAFETIKDALTQSTLAYYDPSKPTAVIV
jgi:hypothetical protein